jgi:hypothetical protein
MKDKVKENPIIKLYKQSLDEIGAYWQLTEQLNSYFQSKQQEKIDRVKGLKVELLDGKNSEFISRSDVLSILEEE